MAGTGTPGRRSPKAGAFDEGSTTERTTRGVGGLGALGAVTATGLAIICCAAGPIMLGVGAGVGAGALIGSVGGALLVAALVCAVLLVARGRRQRRVCRPDDCKEPLGRDATVSGQDRAR